MEFVFEIMPATRPDLADQLARGLDLRTELKSRKKLPKLWKATDKLNEAVTDEAVKRRKTKNRVFGIIFLIVGLFLAVPGLAASNGLNGPLVGGIIALIVGVTYLNPKSNTPPRKCQQMAQKLLDMRRTIPYARVRFNESGMTVNSADTIPYSKIEGVLETEDLYLLIINNSAMFFIKEEIIEGDCESFSNFLKEQKDLAFEQIA